MSGVGVGVDLASLAIGCGQCGASSSFRDADNSDLSEGIILFPGALWCPETGLGGAI